MNEKKKIISINCNYTSGGGKGMLEVAEISRKSGFEYYTVSPYTKNEQSLENHFFITHRWQKFLNRNISGLTGDDNIIPFAQTHKLIRHIESIKPDLVHLRGLHGWYVNYVKLLKYLKKHSIPVVWTQHDCWAFTGKCTHFDKVKCNKWKNSCGSCPLLKDYPKSIFFDKTSMMIERKKRIFTKLDNCTVVAVSKWLERKLHESLFGAYNIITIENGIDTNVFKPTKSSVLVDNNLNDKFVVLGVATSWSMKKGLNDFLNLRKSINNKNVELVLIGANSDVISICKSAGIKAYPRTSNKKELAQWYSACSVFFNPSAEETFGRVTAEAMACGAPIIAYNTTATPDLLKDTNNLVVNAHSIDEVIRGIDFVRDKGKSYFETINVDKAREKYDMKKQFGKYVDLYKTILS